VSPLSASYFAFVAVILLAYWLLSGHLRARLAVLWLANAFFLARFALYLPLLLLATCSVDYALGAALHRIDSSRTLARRSLLSLSLLMNLGLLALTRLLPLRIDGNWRWVFPLSLSFYCFQSLSYTIDAYRGERRLAGSWLSHLAAGTFFVSIVAGPINRMGDLLGQIEAPFHLDRAACGRAVLLLGSGMTKKFLLADTLGDTLVNRIFDTPTLYSGAEALIAAFGYSLQLYYDFSGYTDMALGIGELFGLHLPENFRRPYAALNLREFWKRWHISFSTWIGDYIHNGLLRWLLCSRQHKAMVYLSLLLTMLLSGLWHGSGWTFLVWGGLHGVGLAFVRYWYKHWDRHSGEPSLWWRIPSIFFTFCYVTLAWVFFRASDLPNALAVLGRIVSGSWGIDNISLPVVKVLVAALFFHLLPERCFERGAGLLGRTPFYAQAAVLAGFVLLVQYLAGSSSAPFVYSHF
jgi:D-alanyl-lipoteichoic acid acyltransferase DltB (MBOAT superfamily)